MKDWCPFLDLTIGDDELIVANAYPRLPKKREATPIWRTTLFKRKQDI